MLVYQICAGVLTVALVILIIYAVRFLMQARETAAAVELLVLNANEQVDKSSKVFELVEAVADTLGTTWCRIFGAGALINKFLKK